MRSVGFFVAYFCDFNEKHTNFIKKHTDSHKNTIIFKHVLKPTFLPVISYLGPATAAIITGSVVVEQIFGLPGLGRYFVQGALNRDYTLVMGVVIFYGLLIIGFNLIVDTVYGFIDPRIKHNR